MAYAASTICLQFTIKNVEEEEEEEENLIWVNTTDVEISAPHTALIYQMSVETSGDSGAKTILRHM